MRLPYLHSDPIQVEVQKFSLQNNKIEQCLWQGSLVRFNHLLMQGFKRAQGNAHCAKFESHTNRVTFETNAIRMTSSVQAHSLVD